MKLQLTETQVAAIATKLGEKRPRLVEDVVRVLSALAEMGVDPLTRKDVTAALSALGWDCTPEHAWKDIGSAIEMRCDKTGERGFYSQKGLRAVSPPVVASAPSTSDVEVVKRAGLAFVPEVVLTLPDVEGYYAGDEGLRRMAVADSPCYGVAHSPKASACQACPLATFCAKASMAVFSDIAAALDAETEKAITSAKEVKVPLTETLRQVAATPVTPTAIPVTTIHDSVMFDLPETKTTAELLEAKFGKTGYSEIALPFEGVCGHCDKTLPKDFKATHVPGKGVLHPECALKL